MPLETCHHALHYTLIRQSRCPPPCRLRYAAMFWLLHSEADIFDSWYWYYTAHTRYLPPTYAAPFASPSPSEVSPILLLYCHDAAAADAFATIIYHDAAFRPPDAIDAFIDKTPSARPPQALITVPPSANMPCHFSILFLPFRWCRRYYKDAAHASAVMYIISIPFGWHTEQDDISAISFIFRYYRHCLPSPGRHCFDISARITLFRRPFHAVAIIDSMPRLHIDIDAIIFDYYWIPAGIRPSRPQMYVRTRLLSLICGHAWCERRAECAHWRKMPRATICYEPCLLAVILSIREQAKTKHVTPRRSLTSTRASCRSVPAERCSARSH